MLATNKSFAVLGLILTLGVVLVAAPQSPGAKSFLAHAERVMEKTRLEWQNDPQSPQTACHFARATAILASLVTADDRRADLATRGIETCRPIIKTHPKHGPAYYFLALNLGQLARTRTLSAFKIIKEMETSFLQAIQLTPTLDYAGPHRALAILYRDAPGWPASIGNRKKARTHLEKAIRLAPHYPGNRLAYLVSLVKWGEDRTATNHLASTHAILQSARRELTGEDWASSWAEWDEQWNIIKARFPGLVPPPRPTGGD